MKIAIDGIFMTTVQPGGYRTYTANLVHALTTLSSQHKFYLLADRSVNLELPSNWCVEMLPRLGSFGFIWREQARLPRYLGDHAIDVLHMPGATGPLVSSTPLVVTIYDTIEFTDPLPSLRHTKRWAMRAYSRLVQSRTARQAAHLITISHYSKAQIVERFGIAAEKITVTPLAPAARYTTDSRLRNGLAEFPPAIAKGSVLAIASAAPRKNTNALLTAYARLPRSIQQKHGLILVCTHASAANSILRLVAALSLEDRVLMMQGISDDTLAMLYRTAGVFVFPSLEEGFGLPPLEAMACGAPVIASNTSSLPEVLGDAAMLVSPTDIDGLATAIEWVLTDANLADTMREKGLLRSSKFSWRETARQTLSVYEMVGGL